MRGSHMAHPPGRRSLSEEAQPPATSECRIAVRAGASASFWGLCEEARIEEALRLQWLPVSFPEHRAHKSSGIEAMPVPRFSVQRSHNPSVFCRL